MLGILSNFIYTTCKSPEFFKNVFDSLTLYSLVYEHFRIYEQFLFQVYLFTSYVLANCLSYSLNTRP